MTCYMASKYSGDETRARALGLAHAVGARHMCARAGGERSTVGAQAVVQVSSASPICGEVERAHGTPRLSGLCGRVLL